MDLLNLDQLLRSIKFADEIVHYSTTLATLTLLILFSKTLKISPKRISNLKNARRKILNLQEYFIF
jgi:hypothetical protein